MPQDSAPGPTRPDALRSRALEWDLHLESARLIASDRTEGPMQTHSSRQKDLREELLKERDALIARERLGLITVREDRTQEGAGDEGDVCIADLQSDLDAALLEMRAEALQQVEDALERIDQGGYGLCVDCGKGIAPGRLRALPSATRCVACESRVEAAPKRPAVRTIVVRR